MFGSFHNLGRIAPQRLEVDPKDVPPPTPVTLPRYQPFAKDESPADAADTIPNLLRHSGRVSPLLLGPAGLSAIGLDLALDATPEELLPDPSYIPDFAQWARLSAQEAEQENPSTRKPLRNGNLSPGCQTYLERKRELSHPNEDGFRTVRRIPPPKGKPHARLGNAYEFFRCLEEFTTYWDDPTQPPPQLPPSPELTPSEESNQHATPPAGGGGGGSGAQSTPPPNSGLVEKETRRMAAGSSMPAEYRQNLLSAFLKLVAYDFGCNVSFARVEPRLQLSTPDQNKQSRRHQRKTYIASTCSFVWQSATTREAARAGQMTGPVAVVSARPTVDFETPGLEAAQSLDLAREVIGALIAAQHRARQGKSETRFGQDKWWTSQPRWGGGSGGPIGREVDRDAVQGDKDAKPTDSEGMPMAKKPRKNMSIYDSYRMVRPPSSTWDKKTIYEAVGKRKGSDCDDIFVISSLFHHISILRVRVPNRLMEVLEGSPEADERRRSWGRVKAWRSKWFDLFVVDQRIEALQLLWSVMNYQMRADAGDGDVAMADA